MKNQEIKLFLQQIIRPIFQKQPYGLLILYIFKLKCILRVEDYFTIEEKITIKIKDISLQRLLAYLFLHSAS